MGHLRIPHDLQRDPFQGCCPFHADCLEGLASGPAIEQRWKQRSEDLSQDHPAWDLEGHYLALGLMNIVVTLSPKRVILGGGVMKNRQLFPLIRAKLSHLLNGYVQSPEVLTGMEAFVVPPALGDNAGILGAIALAEQAGGTIGEISAVCAPCPPA
jgi:fructokinase